VEGVAIAPSLCIVMSFVIPPALCYFSLEIILKMNDGADAYGFSRDKENPQLRSKKVRAGRPETQLPQIVVDRFNFHVNFSPLMRLFPVH
jgi:hypothetical protein